MFIPSNKGLKDRNLTQFRVIKTPFSKEFQSFKQSNFSLYQTLRKVNFCAIRFLFRKPAQILVLHFCNSKYPIFQFLQKDKNSLLRRKFISVVLSYIKLLKLQKTFNALDLFSFFRVVHLILIYIESDLYTFLS